MSDHSEAFVAFDSSKLRNTVAIEWQHVQRGVRLFAAVGG
jgi:hypothetical protein